ncbi:DinB family protein [Alkalihalobacillus trypoxylicola]|uniref:Damage-inducible protein DinB n=1 Tax=Alkalihalobacillus trypoxylicola TaxID=519424 RepID=A0A161PB66_9BACI|nr:DinB family protein [Alkalihalobacillus trypoxylicola]KYG29462.1 damage-inducible protein DinB [Alkalihalobacillus trypoxylicola]
MNVHEELVKEIIDEFEKTKSILTIIPENHWSWRPHVKSMSIGQLALHIASIPGNLAQLFRAESHEIPDVPLPEVASKQELMAEFERSKEIAMSILANWNEDDLQATWSMTNNGVSIMNGPRYSMVRSLLFNHWYHHRGQLIVYLRMLDVAVPGMYGPSADEA